MSADVLSDLVITRVRAVTTIYNDVNAPHRRENRPRWAIVLKYEGQTVYNCAGHRYLSDLNNMVILPMGCTYEWQCTRAGHCAMIEFDSPLSYPEILPFPVRSGERILRMFRELDYKRMLKKPMYEAESIRDAYSILLKLCQSDEQKYQPREKLSKIAPALDYIAKHYNEKISNDGLASLTGLSTAYFRKLFTEVVGTSPNAYIHDLRIKKAREMLKSDHGSITDIALSLGYNDIFDFSRDFKKHTGVSPSKYV